MSIRRRAPKTVIGPEAKLAAANAGRNSLLRRDPSELESVFMPYDYPAHFISDVCF